MGLMGPAEVSHLDLLYIFQFSTQHGSRSESVQMLEIGLDSFPLVLSNVRSRLQIASVVVM